MAKLTSIGCGAAIMYLLILAVGLYGWVMNVIYLIQCDFAPSYKAEILRGLGVLIPPVGSILGFLPNAVGI